MTSQEKETTTKNSLTDGTESLEAKIAEMKNIPTEKDLTNLLKERTIVVTFKKLDGDERVMTCTKNFDAIPKEHHPKTDKQPPKGNVTVWDINAKGWRSFKYDRVTRIEEI